MKLKNLMINLERNLLKWIWGWRQLFWHLRILESENLRNVTIFLRMD